LVLLREGHVVLSGSQAELHRHLAECGIVPNPNEDFADWLTSFLTDPASVWKRDTEARGKQSGMRSFRKSFREEHQHHDEAHPPQHGFGDFLAPPGSPCNHSDSGAHVPVPVAAPAAVSPPASALNRVADANANAQKQEAEGPREVVFHLGSDDAHADEGDAQAAARVGEDADQGKIVVTAADVPASQSNGSANGDSNDNGSGSAALGGTRRKGLGHVISSKGVPLSTTALAKRFEASAVHKDLLAEIQTRNDALRQGSAASLTKGGNRSAFTTAQYYQRQSWSVWHHTRTCLHRQWQFMSRSPTFIVPRVVQSVVMGLVAGSLFYQLDPSLFAARYGLILFSLTFLSFVNMAEVPLASEFKKVVAKQVDSGFYSPLSYVFSVVLMHLPLSIVECGVMGTILYWMSGFAVDVDDGQRHSHTHTLLCSNLLGCVGLHHHPKANARGSKLLRKQSAFFFLAHLVITISFFPSACVSTLSGSSSCWYCSA